MRQFRLCCPLLLGALLCGCARLEYQSLSPSARSFHEDPGVDEMYFGAEARFAITDRAQQRYLAAAALPAPADTLDAWNPVIAWEQTAPPAEPPIAHAATDDQPASDD